MATGKKRIGVSITEGGYIELEPHEDEHVIEGLIRGNDFAELKDRIVVTHFEGNAWSESNE